MTAAETAKLEALRRRRVIAKWLWIALAPLLWAALVASTKWDTSRPLLAVLVAYAGVFFYMGFFVQRFRCPRCAKRVCTGRRTFWQPKVRFCPHCGLDVS